MTHRSAFQKKAITAEDRREIARRYGCAPGRSIDAPCAYCGTPGIVTWKLQERGSGWVQFDGLEMDHVVAEVLGGKAGMNLVLACMPCNRSKGSKTLDAWNRRVH